MVYTHKVKYYETDRMQCTHHSNYIRFMEEARLDFLDKLGYNYAKTESEGIISPVLSVSVQYKHTTTFDDEIDIEVRLKSMTQLKTEFEYTMTCNGKVVCLATSVHCYLDDKMRPVALKKVSPALYELFSSILNQKD